MEPTIPVKKNKPKTTTSAIRVKNETKRKILSELAKINRKDFGKKVRVEHFISLAISLIEPKHLKDLQERTLTYADRLERDYRAYTAKHGPISKDEYLGKRLSGELSASNDGSKDVEKSTS